ncbi:hypothetical protein ACM66B_006231 [Microbotryomycetes sp. NB124-2]
MASLNWTMLSPTRQPMPLPHEKLVHSIPGVVLRLFPLPSGAPLSFKPPSDTVHKATGTVYLSNKRIIFVSANSSKASSALTSSSGMATDNDVDTFSVPYTHFHDGRFVQPWFGANYYEGSCLPAPGGGLDELITATTATTPTGRDAVRPTSIAVTYTFNEAGGFQFYETVEEMKQRIGDAPGSSTPQESLPLYTPSSSSAPLATSSLAREPVTVDNAVSTNRPSSEQPPAASSAPNVQQQDLDAACIATQAEQDEDRQVALGLDERPPSVNATPGTHGSRIQQSVSTNVAGERVEGDLPPGYEP